MSTMSEHLGQDAAAPTPSTEGLTWQAAEESRYNAPPGPYTPDNLPNPLAVLMTRRPHMSEPEVHTHGHPQLHQNQASETNINSDSDLGSAWNPIVLDSDPDSDTPTPPADTAPEYTVPRWQPDSEVTHCPICGALFTMLYRKHHCRKCGRVVCDRCSPHRIIIPSQFVVRPYDHAHHSQQRFLYGNEGSIVDFASLGGGERVRLCNPCVPDPNMTPPQPPPVSGPHPRARPSRTQSNSLGHPSNESGAVFQWLSAQELTRMRSATTNAGQPLYYLPPNPSMYRDQLWAGADRHRLFTGSPRRRSVTAGRPPDQRGSHTRSHSTETIFPDFERPLPRAPAREIPEEDICPVCHLELPSRALANFELLRETHINNCISSRITPGAGRATTTTTTGAVGSGSHGTPPPRTTRRTRMIPYVSTEKDCDGTQECIICLETFVVGEKMARLECFCRFHQRCIDSWFVNHPGRCPVHQHDSYGY
ncbi:FYVE zinc finger-domain-containing protein [Xylariaceae sp. FL0594]|nr:FYVE zinc finger-domain-containing protein [Xylariaceae sp. FL0594]